MTDSEDGNTDGEESTGGTSDFIFTYSGGTLFRQYDSDNIVDGTGEADTLTGGEEDDVLMGRAGDDTLSGGAGDDWIIGGSGDDTLSGDAGDDALLGGSGDDTLSGGAGDDLLHGSTGDDDLSGGAGRDTLIGDAGDDTLTGGAGADTFVYIPGGGNDTIEDFTDGEDNIDLTTFTGVTGFADLTITADGDDAEIDLSAHGGGTLRLENVNVSDLDAEDFLFYGQGRDFSGTEKVDLLIGGVGDDTISGQAGDDTLFGITGDDTIYGGAGDDTIDGGEGDDTIDGGAGDDTMSGGSGADTFAFQAGHGNDTIQDFKDVSGGENDTIDLTAFTGITGYSDLTGKITQDGDDTKIDLSSFGGGEIVIEDFTSTDLDATDFDFSM